jgi:hypothetical protein
LKSNKEYKSKDYGEALRRGFLQVDEELETEKGRDEVIAMKKKNPPNKSPLFKILGDSLTGGESGADTSTAIDSIGCTANVIII